MRRHIRRIREMRARLAEEVIPVEAGAGFEAVFEAVGEEADEVVAGEIGPTIERELL